MSKLYPARVRVAVEVAPRPRAASFLDGVTAGCLTLAAEVDVPGHGPIRHWFFPIGCRWRCRGGRKATLDPRSYSKDGQTI
jgi:hypothetical protein